MAVVIAVVALPAIALLLAMAARIEHLIDAEPRPPQR
jgi:hypothetical protein